MSRTSFVAAACAIVIGVATLMVWRQWTSRLATGQDAPGLEGVHEPVPGLVNEGDKTASPRTHRRKGQADGDASEQGGKTNRIIGAEGRWLDADDAAVITQTLDAALDDEDTDRILSEAARLKQHADPDVRSRVAFALFWTGMRGFPELTTMLTDPDPEVAAEALEHWKSALSEIESQTDKASLLGAASQVLGAEMPDDVLFDLVQECSLLDSEYALPKLADLLGIVTLPEQKQEVIDALHNAMERDDPSTDAKELIQQAKQEAARLEAERLAEEQSDPEEASGSGGVAGPAQGIPGPNRRRPSDATP